MHEMSFLNGKEPSYMTFLVFSGIQFQFILKVELGYAAAAAAKSLQSCLTLWDPIDSSPPGSPVPGILQASNTGVGCHFLLQCMHACQVTSVVSDSMRPYGQQPNRLLCPWDFPGKSTGMGCHCLLQQLGYSSPLYFLRSFSWFPTISFYWRDYFIC